jgi:hypothetical protein
VAAIVLFAAPAAAFEVGPGVGLQPPTLIQLTGYVGTAPAHADTIGSVTLGLPQGVAKLVLSHVQIRNSSLIEGMAALRGVELYNPNLQAVGNRALLHAISNAAPQTRLTVYGYLEGGSHQLIVVAVQPA